VRLADAAALALALAACARPAAPHAKAASRVANAPSSRAEPIRMPAPAPPPERWFFEWLSNDGKRALLRRIDGRALSPMQTRVVDVDTGAMLEDAPLEELGHLPPTTLGSGATTTMLAELDRRLGERELGADLMRGAKITRAFPFGSCGRFSAAPRGDAIAFNAGDWIYVADEAGRVRKRVSQEAAYDPRFTPDGKHLLFRRASGRVDGVFAKYELFVVPSDLSASPRSLRGTAGARDRFVIDAQGKSAVAIASHEPQIKTCALSVALRPPFSVKKLACLDGAEPLVDAVLSPKGRWAAMTTQRDKKWHLRVVSLQTGKVVLDEPAQTGLVIRAISDDGLLVQSGPRGVIVDDVRANSRRRREVDVDLGHRGFFRSASELVFVRGSSVAVVDLAER
jgi:hypothetical protein